MVKLKLILYLGKKDITAVLLPTRDRGPAADETFETLPATAATKDTQKQSPLEPKQGIKVRTKINSRR